jgi:hypothetical protein
MPCGKFPNIIGCLFILIGQKKNNLADGRMNMTESNEPEKKDETAEPTEDEPIIELKDEMAVEQGDDEEPIDLTEVVEESVAEDKDETAEVEADAATADEAPIAPEEALKGDEEIIDLLQAVEEAAPIDTDETISAEVSESTGDQAPQELELEEAEAKEPAEDEAPIALEEKVADETTEDDEIIDLADAAEDEAIIDLTETAGETSLKTEDIGEPISEDFDTATEFDDISEFDSDLIQEDSVAGDEPDSETMVDDALKDDFADVLGIELDSEKDAQENLFDADKVTGEQVEAALERVIKKMFYEKIDRLLVDTIEKTVTREIEKLKKALLDDATDSEK